jgi:1-acyl-sn-glycerol-3-phosphate acyltransferase
MAPFGGSTMTGMTTDPSDPTPTASRSGRTGTRSSRSTGSDRTRTQGDGAGQAPRRDNGSGRSRPEPARASGAGEEPGAEEVDFDIIAEATEQTGRTGLEESVSVSILPVPRPRPDDHGPDEARLSDVDEWGRSENMRSIVRRLYDPAYRYWFRVEWEGLEKIPLHGGALLIANHAGAIPSDAPAIMHGIEEELGRPVYGLADYFFRTIPVVGTLWSRTGGVPAHPDNAYRLLHDQQQLALVFPEGTKATSKTYSDRYRLRRFGRGGFVEIAMRAGVPVVPIAVVGAEESMPIIFRINSLARVFNLPYFPVTANALLMGPLGYFTYFPAKIKIRVLDPISFDVEPCLERYSRSRVMDEAENIRATLQDNIHDMLRERRSVWFG